ncbi:MAG: adenosine kinase [Alphaproteobacteria bacterium]|nr:adenosine kinase [Alphaproteobacteria bacterium]
MYDLCAIGNALVDIIVSADDKFLQKNGIVKGSMRLVDESVANDLYEKTGPAVELSSGGSAANTIAGAASIGISCAYLGRVGKDEFGDVFTHDLAAQNIHFATRPSVESATGRCIILVTPDAQRSMNTFLGAASEFGPEDIDAETVQSSSITYLEGYLFDKLLAQEAFVKAAKLAHQAKRKVALTLSDVFCVERHREEFLGLIRNGVDILFANENEAKALCQTPDLSGVLHLAKASVDIAVITRSEKGAIVVSGDNTFEVPANLIPKVVDTTGAGDLFAAGFLSGLCWGRDLADCGKIGAIAASEVISHYGPRPQKKLKDII